MTFKTDGFRDRYLDYERLVSEELILAEQSNITDKFQEILKKKLNRFQPENISIVIYGPPRDGKSYTALSILQMIKNHINTTYDEEKTIHICVDESDFLNKVKTATFQDMYLIDEKKETMVQEGSFVEGEQMKDIDNICAVKSLIVIRLKPQEIWNTNAMITLKTHGKDTDTFMNRLLVKTRELGGERWIGHIRVSLLPIFCDDRKQGLIGSCVSCPRFQYKGKENDRYCTHWIADYERAKMVNVDNVLSGASETRHEEMMKLAIAVSTHPEFGSFKSAAARRFWLKSVVNSEKEFPEHYTNRRLTIKELEEIDSYAKAIKERDEAEV